MPDRVDQVYISLITYGLMAFFIYLIASEYSRITSGESGTDSVYVKKCTANSILNYPVGLKKEIRHCSTVYAEMGIMVSAPAQKVRFDYFGPHDGVDCFVADTRNWDCTTSVPDPFDGRFYPYSREGEVQLDGIWHVKQVSALEYWKHKIGAWLD